MRPLLLVPIFLFTFLTGAAGLIYEVTWQKYLSRILGSDSVATAVILATFLGGLSAGYYLCGRLTTRVTNHFKAYAILEGTIGVWGLLFPTLFNVLDSATRGWSFSPPLLITVQGLLCSGLLMAVPALCMGGTIPFLTRGISRSLEEATGIHARVYGINTAGAFVGALAAGFFLIPALGLPATVRQTALLNIIAALFFFAVSAMLKSPKAGISDVPKAKGKKPPQSPKELSPFRYPPRLLYGVAFLGGFCVMTLENVLIRLTDLSIGSSSYSFTIIVSVFVLAIAIGSSVVGTLKRLPRSLLFFNQLLVALLLMLLYLSIDTWPYWAHLIRITIQSNIAGFWAYYTVVFVVLTLVLILPVSLMGATVPITFHEVKRDLANVGRHSGLLFSWNTVGNLAGSLAGGMLLYYALDLPGIFSLAIFLAALSACLVAWTFSKKYFIAAAAVAAAALVFVATTPFYDVNHFIIGTFQLRAPLEFSLSGPRDFFTRLNEGTIPKFHKDGPTASVGVNESPEMSQFEGQKFVSIVINGKGDSSIIGDVYTLKLLAHLPAILASQRRQAMVIGLGTGVTAGELALYPEVEAVDVAEISPTVVEALPHFSAATHNVQDNPKVRIHIGDAFRVLGRSHKKWDIITSEPSNPWVSGVDQLFTKEFYSLAKEHLSADGILVQWVQRYDLDLPMVGMIVNTVSQQFRQCRVFMASASDLLVLATDREFTRDDLDRAESVLRTNQAVHASLDTIHLSSLDEILLRELWPPSYNRFFFSGSGVQTMDNPMLQYIAGKTFFTGVRVEENALLNSNSASYVSEYLLVKRHTDWATRTMDPGMFQSLFESAKDLTAEYDLPMAAAVKLKAYLSDPGNFPLTDQERQFFMVDLIPMITGKGTGDEAWAGIGLGEASYRRKAEVMLFQIGRCRNWIVPYPMDGIKALLEQGIARGNDPYEQNWCALQAVLLRMDERAASDQIKAILSRLQRDENGRILLTADDEVLWNSIQTELKSRWGG